MSEKRPFCAGVRDWFLNLRNDHKNQPPAVLLFSNSSNKAGKSLERPEYYAPDILKSLGADDWLFGYRHLDLTIGDYDLIYRGCSDAWRERSRHLKKRVRMPEDMAKPHYDPYAVYWLLLLVADWSRYRERYDQAITQSVGDNGNSANICITIDPVDASLRNLNSYIRSGREFLDQWRWYNECRRADNPNAMIAPKIRLQHSLRTLIDETDLFRGDDLTNAIWLTGDSMGKAGRNDTWMLDDQRWDEILLKLEAAVEMANRREVATVGTKLEPPEIKNLGKRWTEKQADVAATHVYATHGTIPDREVIRKIKSIWGSAPSRTTLQKTDAHKRNGRKAEMRSSTKLVNEASSAVSIDESVSLTPYDWEADETVRDALIDIEARAGRKLTEEENLDAKAKITELVWTDADDEQIKSSIVELGQTFQRRNNNGR